MTKTGFLKLLGLLFGPILVMAIIVYVLYPYIHKEKYQQVNERLRLEKFNMQSDSVISAGKTIKTDSEQAELTKEENSLQKVIDSLRAADKDLRQMLDRHLEEQLEQTANQGQVNLQKEEFEDKVKTLLSLDEDDLIPILEQLNEEQIVLLYEVGTTMQKRKLLRSLNPDRAAKLITEIMR